MIQSMTGYGKAICELKNKKVTVEIKSLNSKQLDLNVRFPELYKEKELEMRSEISKRLQRGKIDFSIFGKITGEEKKHSINTILVKSYYKELKKISEDLNSHDSTDFMNIIMRLPNILRSDKDEFDKNEWNSIKTAIDVAIQELIDFRVNEGKVLEKDFIKRIGIIQNLAKKISPFEKERIEKIKKRLQQNLYEFTDKKNIDQNRFEQELIYYLEKIDITEEKVRLNSHCDYFLKTLPETDANGKKLGFIVQEMGREINTIGSKANDVNIQKIVVQMKDELEKIKEQLYNVL